MNPQNLNRKSSNSWLISELCIHGMRLLGAKEESNNWKAERGNRNVGNSSILPQDRQRMEFKFYQVTGS